MSKVNFFYVDSWRHGPGVVASKSCDLPAGEFPFEECSVGGVRLRFANPHKFSMRERSEVVNMAKNDPVFGRFVTSGGGDDSEILGA